MSIRDEIFPGERNPAYVQTEWARGWTAAAAGFGYAAEFLTKNATAFGATIDQTGLAVFYLQRHRIELVLKDLLDCLGVDFPPTHSLRRLWQCCEEGFTETDLNWTEFEEECGDFIDALSEVDDGATVFRFPVDTDGNEAKRPAFIDLNALNRHADTFFWAAAGCIAFLTETKAMMDVDVDFEYDDGPTWADV